MRLMLERQVLTDEYSLGELFAEGQCHASRRMASGHLAWTAEDCDRELEEGNPKLWGASAIPLGTYTLYHTWSARFRRRVLCLAGVPDYSRVYLHGGNKAADTHGCPLVGAVRTSIGVRDCGAVVAWLEREVPDGSTIAIVRATGSALHDRRTLPTAR